MSSPWLFVPRPAASPRARLLIFPHSGGGPPAFRGWEDRLPPEVELVIAHLPGRLSRLREAPVREPERLLAALLTALRPRLDLPLVLLGHSLGARVALALAHRLRRAGLPAPQALIVSGRRGPSLPDPRPPMHGLPQALFLRELERRYGALDEALRHPELAAMMFPALQADLQLSETWPAEVGPPLELPIYARGGDADISVGPEHLQAWRAETTGDFSVRRLAGGHFYLLRDPDPFVASIREVLERAAAGG